MMSMSELLNGSMLDAETQRAGNGQLAQARSQLLQVEDVVEFESPFTSKGIHTSQHQLDSQSDLSVVFDNIDEIIQNPPAEEKEKS